MDGGGGRERGLSTQAWSLLAVIREVNQAVTKPLHGMASEQRSDIGWEWLSSPASRYG